VPVNVTMRHGAASAVGASIASHRLPTNAIAIDNRFMFICPFTTAFAGRSNFPNDKLPAFDPAGKVGRSRICPSRQSLEEAAEENRTNLRHREHSCPRGIAQYRELSQFRRMGRGAELQHHSTTANE
jgi:hypothetical protein